MKISTLFTVGLAASVHAQVEMDRLMRLKTDHWNSMRAQGVFNRYDNARLGAAVPAPCVNGKSGPYSCDKVDMLSFLSHSQLGSSTKEGNDIWGKQDPSRHGIVLDLPQDGPRLMVGSLAPWARLTAPPLWKLIRRGL